MKTLNFFRSLNKDERKSFLEYGEVAGLESACPLFSWSQKPAGKRNKADEGRFFNEISFTEVGVAGTLVQTPNDAIVATDSGIVIVLSTELGMEKYFYFPDNEYTEAVDFYNKMVVALEKNNNF